MGPDWDAVTKMAVFGQHNEAGIWLIHIWSDREAL
jgi:hypothetical protein